MAIQRSAKDIEKLSIVDTVSMVVRDEDGNVVYDGPAKVAEAEEALAQLDQEGD